MSERILIVEDETKIAALLRDYFMHAGYDVEVLHRGDEVADALRRRPADLVVLDLQLPGKDGLTVCRELRGTGGGPAIMMLTARVDEVDRLLGLELGADDYVCKPFSPREVVARAKAILRRLRPQLDAGGCLRVGPLELDPIAHVARAAGHELNLTPIEFGLLAALLEQPQRVWSRAQLLERVRGTDFPGYERNIDGHIKNLRRKLREHLAGCDPIRSVYGVGYGLDAGALGA
ncbi:two-component system, OmpR family, response regulator BaeR [Fontimonas thermophila]|uniref:Two-component system, OmpR family, response regulator BaeR n=1 Tax=Fontimonas thermophila TaxID=1076937 RepID=A0A1I2KCV8_9GAMM|nr:response regulator [Fontimonas thermophila]SFF64814.1 two-component system, OmpR family, response regulator BaeR [Fontimonas thermophila]